VKEFPKVSIIIPVKNEAKQLPRCIESLKGLDYPKGLIEIIISDGLSTDGTRKIAVEHGVKVIENVRGIVSSGRNRGFEISGGEVIAFTDADCLFDRAWMKNSIKYFNDGSVGGIGGMTLPPEESTPFEKAINIVFGIAESFRSTSHKQSALSSEEVQDIPGCNAIYRREALLKVMPVDENLLTAEDVWMNYRLRSFGYKLLYAPDVVLWHYRRNGPRSFIKQIFRFATGRAQVGKRSTSLLNFFHIVSALFLPFLLLTGCALLYMGGIGLLLTTGPGILIFLVLYFLAKTRSPKVAFNVPFVLLLFATTWSCGFLRELIAPLKDAKGK